MPTNINLSNVSSAAIKKVPEVNPVQLIDPISQEIQQPYIVNGLTYKSNNSYVIDRDAGGNIKLHESASNQRLIIEPSIENITNESFVEVVDTQFKYFKFPAKIRSGQADTLQGIEFEEIDNISGYYVPPYLENPDTGAPSTYRRLNTSYESDWLSNGAVDSSGLTRIPFEKAISGPGQSEPGTFTFTPAIIKELKDRNNTVRFIAHITCAVLDGSTENTSVAFCINRTMPSNWRNNLKIGNAGFPIYDATSAYGGGVDRVQTMEPIFGHQAQLYPSLTIDYIVDIGEVAEYDAWEFRAVVGGPAWYLSDLCYLEVQVIPDPGDGFATGIYGLQQTGTIGDYYINNPGSLP